jgi:hypothetical protein
LVRTKTKNPNLLGFGSCVLNLFGMFYLIIPTFFTRPYSNSIKAIITF